MRRFSIHTLMAVVVIAAIGMAAIRTCSAVWSGAMLSLTFFALTCSLLGIAFLHDSRRVYWIGFATLGWTLGGRSCVGCSLARYTLVLPYDLNPSINDR